MLGIPARFIRRVATMIQVGLFTHTDGAEREEGYIEFTDLFVEHSNEWAYRCHPSGILTFEEVEAIAETLLWSERNSGFVEKYRWVKMAKTLSPTMTLCGKCPTKQS
jgi:hypothetical protein